MSDLDLSKLVSSPPKKDDSKSGTTTGSPGMRRRMDGQITEYNEGSSEGIGPVEDMLKADPENLDLMDWLSFLYYSNNRLDDAIQLYRKLLAHNHKAESQYFYLGNAYYRKGILPLAVEQWKRCVASAPESSMARKAQARIDETQK